MSGSTVLSLYRAATSALGPFAGAWLQSRADAGKEDASRLPERFGHANGARPEGTLIWLHGASVGEMGVARQLIDALLHRNPTLNFLVTTGTRTSADLFAKRPPPRARHAFVPLDRADAARRFLAHWRPNLGVFIESDLWPNLILEAERARVPLALVNARMSPKTLSRWTGWPSAARRLLSAFSLVLAADKRTADALSSVRTTPVPLSGNVKLAATAPHIDPAERATLASEVGARRVWLAASTHEGEDEIVLAAHALLRRDAHDALLILAPRHPERGEAVAVLAGAAPRRAIAQNIGTAPVYVFDTLGELGLGYACSPVSFVAGSLLPHLKGHNPVEPALMQSLVVAGPHVESFGDLYADLRDANGALTATNAEEIAAAVRIAWNEPARADAMKAAAHAVIARGAAALEQTTQQLAALLPARAPVNVDATA